MIAHGHVLPAQKSGTSVTQIASHWFVQQNGSCRHTAVAQAEQPVPSAV